MEKNPEQKNTTCGVIALITMGMLILYGVGAAIFYVTLQNISLTFDTMNQSIETLNQSINNIYTVMTMEASIKEQNLPMETTMPSISEEATPYPIPPTLTPLSTISSNAETCDCERLYTCDDFETPEKAQICFLTCDGSADNNWSDLDPDRDGQACEPSTTYP